MNPFHIGMQNKAREERWRDPLYWKCVHMRRDHTLGKEWDREAERGTVSLTDNPWESNTLPRVWAGVWPLHTHAHPHTHTHTHVTFVCVHPLLVTSTLCFLNPGHTPCRLWCIFFFFFLLDVFNNNLFHPSKRPGFGKKGLALKASLHLLPRLSSETKLLHPYYSEVQLQLKRDGDQIPSHTQQNNTVAFSVWLPTRKGPFLSTADLASIYLAALHRCWHCLLRVKIPSKDHCFPCSFSVIEFFLFLGDGRR